MRFELNNGYYLSSLGELSGKCKTAKGYKLKGGDANVPVI